MKPFYEDENVKIQVGEEADNAIMVLDEKNLPYFIVKAPVRPEHFPVAGVKIFVTKNTDTGKLTTKLCVEDSVADDAPSDQAPKRSVYSLTTLSEQGSIRPELERIINGFVSREYVDSDKISFTDYSDCKDLRSALQRMGVPDSVADGMLKTEKSD
jgi:hypothetical protein